MIIWRGLGILTILFIALGLAGIGSIGSQPGSPNLVSRGAGLLVSGALTFLVGYWFNVRRPRQQVETYLAELRAQCWQRVQAGTFQLEPGAAAPRSPQEAATQVESLLQAQRQQLLRRRPAHSSLFFIPMHWIGLVLGVLGAGLLVGGLLLALR